MAPSRPREPRVLATLAAIALLLSACGGSVSSAPAPLPTVEATPDAVSTPGATPSPAPTPQATPELSAAAAPSADPNTFVSPRYGYAITLPPGSLIVGWHAAERAWNGTAALESGGPYLDRAAISEGGIHMFGAPSTSLEEWFGTVEGNGIHFHGCTEAQNRRDASVGDAQAIAFTQNCGNGEIWDRVAIYKDGYGIGLWLHPTPGAEVAGRDRALELLEGLSWPR